MNFLLDNCTFSVLTKEIIQSTFEFDCGHKDLNEFFLNDTLDYSKQLLGKSYCFKYDENPKIIICAFTLSNDSIKANFLPNSRKKKVNDLIPRVKQYRSYPAVLIGRLGVNKDFKGRGIGKELMDFIKSWFIDSNNKTGCRFLVVDAYNEPGPIKYYQNNGFKFLFGDEDQERLYTGLNNDRDVNTRLMYFDLLELSTI
ncbi:acetyltransferase [Belliella baltica DSM 15883]|uniref:Acetyltransferase n=1 Tax=Belliella baltica (strain DSM 15883 / CIP 108006 / LMG 21964 / BA134) TaxID=866536 RepID=I3Z764_BELBD|nr:GNAT family N-acetyltransferase [Belliella baltica]AFL85082.1 acetyltransferase [Belliella baltica DSM 15883]